MSDWTKLAACVDKPHHWWFPEGGTSPTKAVEVCLNECPVREECLKFALTTNQSDGIWGGLLWHERKLQSRYRILHCNQCGKQFTWTPIGGHPPKFCSASCRRSSVAKSRADARVRRLGTRGYGRTHGLIATYNDGCRCEQCRRAAALAKQRQRTRNRLGKGLQSGETLNGPDDAQTSPGPTHHPEATEAVR